MQAGLAEPAVRQIIYPGLLVPPTPLHWWPHEHFLYYAGLAHNRSRVSDGSGYGGQRPFLAFDRRAGVLRPRPDQVRYLQPLGRPLLHRKLRKFP